MDQWTSDPNAQTNPDANPDANPAASENDAPETGYEQPAEEPHPIGDEMSEAAGGPFTGHAQPVGHPDVQEGETPADSPERLYEDASSDAASEANAGDAPEASAADSASESTFSAPGPRIEVDMAEGDLTIVGGAEQATVNASEWSPEFSAVEFDDGMRFNRLPDGAELRVPDGALVIVREVEGDLRCERLDGELRVSRAQGDVRIEDVAVVRLKWVAGDFTADHIGDLACEDVGGDAWLASVQQPCTLGRIGGDLEARRCRGLTITESVGGDVEVERCDSISVTGPIGGDHEIRRMSE